MQKIITAGFQQINERFNQIEDQMKERSSDAKQQLSETVITPEQPLLSKIPGNIDGIKNYPVIYSITRVRILKIGLLFWIHSPLSKVGRVTETRGAY